MQETESILYIIALRFEISRLHLNSIAIIIRISFQSGNVSLRIQELDSNRVLGSHCLSISRDSNKES